eukprot:TRINITY_DN23097_c1_g1_i7.p1 TRINITY_DN23097_c1_g1~~TRINITY_DN23097_c1_g1_i7.p1  ORF type:complete len:115 (+),score=6.87 TRINITY_DN23097_c1_g1_i7:491-835(+)
MLPSQQGSTYTLTLQRGGDGRTTWLPSQQGSIYTLTLQRGGDGRTVLDGDTLPYQVSMTTHVLGCLVNKDQYTHLPCNVEVMVGRCCMVTYCQGPCNVEVMDGRCWTVTLCHIK